jgi:hypothetical protein
MQIQSRFKGLLAILISLLFIWGLFYISSLFLKSSINTNLKYFPKDAEITIRLDGKKLVENVAYDLLCISKDQPVIDKLINYVTQESKDGNVKKIGIDFLSEIGVFVKPVKNGKIIGVLVNLNDPNEFKENAPSITNAIVAISSKDNVGVLLSYLSPNEILSEKELQDIAIEIITKKTENPFKSTINQNVLAEIKADNPIFGKGTIAISEANNTFTFESTLNAEKSIPNNSTYCLKPVGLHVSCAMIPDNYLSVFEQLFPLINKEQLPKIKAISWNYQGLNIQEGGAHNLGFFVQPLTDMLIEFEKPFHLNKHIVYTENFDKWGIKTSLKGLTIGNQKYIVDSLSPTSYFIGIHANNLVKRENPYLLNIEGDMADLLKISGSESISTFIEMIFPAFTSSQDFFKSIENTSIQIKQKGNQIKIKGKLKFKKNKYSYTECLRFMLALKGY